MIGKRAFVIVYAVLLVMSVIQGVQNGMQYMNAGGSLQPFLLTLGSALFLWFARVLIYTQLERDRLRRMAHGWKLIILEMALVMLVVGALFLPTNTDPRLNAMLYALWNLNKVGLFSGWLVLLLRGAYEQETPAATS